MTSRASSRSRCTWCRRRQSSSRLRSALLVLWEEKLRWLAPSLRSRASAIGETRTDARVVRVPSNGGAAEVVTALPGDEIGSVTMTPDGRRFIYPVFTSRSDVWVVDDFDVPLSAGGTGKIFVARGGRSQELLARPFDDDAVRPESWSNVMVLEIRDGVALVAPNEELTPDEPAPQLGRPTES